MANSTGRQITIFSETDLKGIIRFANEDFCLISQYKLDELIGEPQSIVRHPDMPKKLFKILWDAIQKGEVFRGIIKNRAKDRSHYWVSVTIMPKKDQNNETIGYLGVRHLIPDEALARELDEAQAKLLGL
jgi:methyl-accepting chemotaxis protein